MQGSTQNPIQEFKFYAIQEFSDASRKALGESLVHLDGTFYWRIPFSSRKEDLISHLSLKSVEKLNVSYDAFTLDVKSMLDENLSGILGGTQILNGR
jgi:hypothetical protein